MNEEYSIPISTLNLFRGLKKAIYKILIFTKEKMSSLNKGKSKIGKRKLDEAIPENESSSYSSNLSTSEILSKISHLDKHSQLIVQVKLLMREREIARRNADFNKSDALRDKLKGSHQFFKFEYIKLFG
jgi:cysteinyl-tRNA synthetase